MKKKIILGAAAALAFAGCVSAVPLTVSAADDVCVTSVTVGSGQVLSRCPAGFRTGDRRGVSPGAPV